MSLRQGKILSQVEERGPARAKSMGAILREFIRSLEARVARDAKAAARKLWGRN
jgi:hypothetical protein